jgi:toxin ParE1/3/4
MFTVKFMPQAISDLRGISNHIALDKPQRALTFVRELEEKTIGLLAMAPMTGLAFKADLRYFPLSGYVVIYEVLEVEKNVNVLHIVHGRTNWKKLT